jgi:hypothetical protein
MANKEEPSVVPKSMYVYKMRIIHVHPKFGLRTVEDTPQK